MFEMKKNKGGEFFWTIRSKKNGEQIAKSSESYKTRASAMKSIAWMKANVVAADMADLTIAQAPAKKAASKKKKS